MLPEMVEVTNMIGPDSGARLRPRRSISSCRRSGRPSKRPHHGPSGRRAFPLNIVFYHPHCPNDLLGTMSRCGGSPDNLHAAVPANSGQYERPTIFGD